VGFSAARFETHPTPETSYYFFQNPGTRLCSSVDKG